MKFLLDHDVPDRVGGVLVQAGHVVVRLREVLATDSPDRTVLEKARSENCVLITCNRDDFLELAADGNHPGVIILVRRKTRLAECAALLRLVESAGSQGLGGGINFA